MLTYIFVITLIMCAETAALGILVRKITAMQDELYKARFDLSCARYEASEDKAIVEQCKSYQMVSENYLLLDEIALTQLTPEEKVSMINNLKFVMGQERRGR